MSESLNLNFAAKKLRKLRLMDISIAVIQFEDIVDVTLGGRHKEMLIGRHQFSFALLHSLLRCVKQTQNIFML